MASDPERGNRASRFHAYFLLLSPNRARDSPCILMIMVALQTAEPHIKAIQTSSKIFLSTPRRHRHHRRTTTTTASAANEVPWARHDTSSKQGCGKSEHSASCSVVGRRIHSRNSSTNTKMSGRKLSRGQLPILGMLPIGSFHCGEFSCYPIPTAAEFLAPAVSVRRSGVGSANHSPGTESANRRVDGPA